MQEAIEIRAIVTKKKKQADFHSYPFWSPRFWHGMRFGHWVTLLATNGVRIHPTRWPMAFAISLISPVNSAMNLVQKLCYGKRIARTEIKEPPVFIIGHWRSGTTYLHELMVRDERFTFPTTFQCFAPSHVLLTEWIFNRYFGFLMPQRRPMDNMETGWQRPQEDEFALLAMGVPSPYRRIAFPNRPPVDVDWLDMKDVDPRQLERWSRALDYFVRMLTYRDQKRVVLKSPPHTGRVETLARLFPGARFVHIVRDPYAVFPSTQRLWNALDLVQGLQIPRYDNMDDYIFSCFECMYTGFHDQRERLDPAHIVDVRYESLVEDPLGELKRIYSHLDLGDFAVVEPKIVEHLRDQRDYKTNRHELSDEVKQRVQSRWADFFHRYDYPI